LVNSFMGLFDFTISGPSFIKSLNDMNLVEFPIKKEVMITLHLRTIQRIF